MYRSLDCSAVYPLLAAIFCPTALKAAASSAVIPVAVSEYVYPNGHSTSSLYVWKSIPAVICCLPPTTRLRTKSATTFTSGADSAEAPRYVSDDVEPEEPPQQPHL